MMSSTLSSGGCQVCGVTENLKQCSKCRQISYCGKEHQIQDWTEHKKTCTSLVNICKTVEQLTLHNSQEASNCKWIFIRILCWSLYDEYYLSLIVACDITTITDQTMILCMSYVTGK